MAIDDIVMSGDNMREDVGDLEELAMSIKDFGILQPLVVSDHAEGLMLVCGHRRLAAARRAGLKRVPVVVRTLKDDERLSIMVAENVHRKHPTALEEGRAFKRMIDHGMTQYQVASRICKSQAYVSTRLALLDLPEEIQKRVHEGKVGVWDAVNITRKKYKPREGRTDDRDVEGKWQLFYVDKITRWLEAGNLKWDDDALVDRLRLLLSVLSSFVVKGRLEKPRLMCEECGVGVGYIGRCCEDHDRVLCSHCVEATHDLEEGAA